MVGYVLAYSDCSAVSSVCWAGFWVGSVIWFLNFRTIMEGVFCVVMLGRVALVVGRFN